MPLASPAPVPLGAVQSCVRNWLSAPPDPLLVRESHARRSAAANGSLLARVQVALPCPSGDLAGESDAVLLLAARPAGAVPTLSRGDGAVDLGV